MPLGKPLAGGASHPLPFLQCAVGCSLGGAGVRCLPCGVGQHLGAAGPRANKCHAPACGAHAPLGQSCVHVCSAPCWVLGECLCACRGLPAAATRGPRCELLSIACGNPPTITRKCLATSGALN